VQKNRKPGSSLAWNKARRSARAGTAGLVACLAICLGAAIALGAANPFAQSSKAPTLKFKAAPGSASVRAGASVKLKLKFPRGLGKPVLKAAGQPAGAKVSFKVKPAKLKTKAAAVTMTVATAASTPAGSYKIAIKGRQKGKSGKATVRLTVTAAPPAVPLPPAAPAAPAPVATTEPPPSAKVFAVTGAATSALVPGVGQKLDLTIQNLTSVEISIKGLALKAGRIEAPQATGATPCSALDFAYTQLVGAPNLTIPAGGARRLSELGVTPDRLPSIVLQDRPTNQDGCQNAAVTTEIEGTASGARWEGAGSGSIRATAGVAQFAAFAPAAPIGKLVPGEEAELDVTVTNPNSFAVHVGAVALDVAVGSGGFDVDAAHAGCALSALHFARQTNNGVGWQIPPRVGASDGSLLLEMPGALSMDDDAANACQGATFTVHLKGGN
jgi:hypothetical protein